MNTVLGYIAMLVALAVMSYVWKVGPQIVERIHGEVWRRAVVPLKRRLPKIRRIRRERRSQAVREMFEEESVERKTEHHA